MIIKKILCIEDDSDIQTMIKLSLKFKGGYEVILAGDGFSGIEMAEKETPDVILLDVMMPELDGYETCKQLKANPLTKDIPVIFLTARAQEKEIKKGLEMGAIGYLTKPFDPMTIKDELEAVVQRAED